MADPNMIGSTLGWGTVDVEKGRLRDFAKVSSLTACFRPPTWHAC
jgi:hypothetical protein